MVAARRLRYGTSETVIIAGAAPPNDWSCARELNRSEKPAERIPIVYSVSFPRILLTKLLFFVGAVSVMGAQPVSDRL